MPAEPHGRLVVFGAGGSGREIAWLARAVHPQIGVIFVVDSPEFARGPVAGFDVVLLADLVVHGADRFVVGLGDAAFRARAADACESRGLRAMSLVHPGVDVRGLVSVGEGSVICAGCVVTTDVTIGRHVQVNVNASLSHDTVLDDFATISPGATLSGNVHVGRGAFIGAGATVINGSSGDPLVIGAGAVVAGGACVTKHVEPAGLVAGVPAVRKR